MATSLPVDACDDSWRFISRVACHECGADVGPKIVVGERERLVDGVERHERAYRSGEPLITDAEFDCLIDRIAEDLAVSRKLAMVYGLLRIERCDCEPGIEATCLVCEVKSVLADSADLAKALSEKFERLARFEEREVRGGK